ncbi:MAG: bacillithiol biosynthesis BshC, partial [Bacteroidota bacterium]
MQIIKLPYDQVPIAGKDLAYINEAPALQPFFKYPVRLESFRQIIEDKKRENIDRSVLVEVIKSQYWSLRLAPSPAEQRASELLAEENTFTVV